MFAKKFVDADLFGEEFGEGGLIALVQDGDRIEIDIPARTLTLAVPPAEQAARRAEMVARGSRAWTPTSRDRHVSSALQAYAAMTTSAARGAVRDVGRLAKP